MPALIIGHPGARRAALPVAQGDHGRALEGDRDAVARRPRHRPGDRRLARPPTTAVVGLAQPPAARARRGSSARRRTRRPPGRRASSPSGGSSDGARIWVHGELAGDGSLAKLSTEVATLARTSRPRRRGGRRPASSSVPIRRAAAAELATYLPRVLAVDGAGDRGPRRGRRSSRQRLAALIDAARSPTSSSPAPGPEGRDLAGALSALTGLGRPRQRDRRRAGPTTARSSSTACSAASSSPTSALTGGTRHRHGPPERRHRRAGRRRRARSRRSRSTGALGPAGRPRSSIGVAEAGAAASIEEARIIVAGGRGVGGPDGFELVEELAGGARRRGRGDAGGGRLGLDPVQPADRPDRQDRQAAAVPRARHQRRDPAQGRHADRSARSSPSTATPTRRSPSSPTCSWSATCSRSGRRCSPSCGLGPADRGGRGRRRGDRAGRPAADPGLPRAGRRRSRSCCGGPAGSWRGRARWRGSARRSAT